MIFITNTPNNTGVAIHGDYMDFDELYDALHEIVGNESEYTSYEAARMRVLGVCYDIRHAIMGDREIEFVDNGMDGEKMKRLSMITPDKNIYLKIYVLWPEMLFVTMALNDFILLNHRKCKHPQWDKTTAVVRKLQAAFSECIKQTVSDASYKRMVNMMIHDYTWFDGYATQYLDILNCRFLEMDKEKRLKSISTMAKRLVERDDEYRKLRSEVMEAARKYNCPVDDIRLQLEYPEDIEW
ncbi:MAG: hypothetical protein C4554_07355 [Dethiobacter sp.]|jgi:hypothetical protein|nr:MAG: hypothetical protein C4554_07355 [Dethiobacter sp.]